MVKLKAAILLDITSGTPVVDSPGHYAAKHVSGCLAAMGIGYDFVHLDLTNYLPTTGHISANYDLVVIPILNSNNRNNTERFWTPTANTYTPADDALTIPCFVLGAELRQCVGVDSSAYYDVSAVYAEGVLSADNSIEIQTLAQRHVYEAQTLPVISTPIIEDPADDSAVSAWSYSSGVSGDGTAYFSDQKVNINILPLLIQTAINDGQLSLDSIRQLPMVLTLDHLNGDGATGSGGAQEQPEIVSQLGSILRKYGGICYASMEKAYIDGSSGTTTGDLLANIIEYQNEFLLIACHDHQVPYNTDQTNSSSPRTAMQTKTDINASYQATKAAIESLGLSVNTDFAHFANDRANDNFFQLGSRDVSSTSDQAEASVKAGYGFRAARVGDVTQSWPTVVKSTGTTGVPVRHWLESPTVHRDITLVPGSDIGNLNVNTTDSAAQILQSRFNVTNLSLTAPATGYVYYLHPYACEDVFLRGGTSSNGKKDTYGIYAWTQWAKMAAFCKNTLNFGADITNYIK
ncbi:hypothetical protein KAU11_10115 [Candidatus Babeliales bacterium]|nr:hypothetical protein [Candidatus Babeliales bacterium]